MLEPTDSSLSLRDLPTDLRERVIASCREREPSAVGVLVHGSYATATARPDSDLDLGIFISGSPTAHYRTWFEERAAPKPLHISARSDLSLETWQREASEPKSWAMGLPVELRYAWLWSADERLRAAIGECPVLRKPGVKPEVEDMVEALLKARRAHATGDEIGVRFAAQAAARSAAPCVAALNQPAPVRDPRTALDTLTTLPIAPERWAVDLLACLGLAPQAAPGVIVAAERLVGGVLRLLRERDPAVDPQPDIARYVADGTFERLLAQHP